MKKTFVWFCGPSACGKTWLSGACKRNPSLCQQLGFSMPNGSAIDVVRQLHSADETDSLTAGDKPFVFIHWQTSYDRDGYGVQRLMEKAPDATHVVIEIHRAESERWTAFREKPFCGNTEEEIVKRFFDWPKEDYSEICKHSGRVNRFVRVFLAGDIVHSLEPIGS